MLTKEPDLSLDIVSGDLGKVWFIGSKYEGVGFINTIVHKAATWSLDL